MKTIENVRAVVALISYRRDQDTDDQFLVKYFAGSKVMYVQHTYMRLDAISGQMERGYGRKWHISPHATDSEIVLTCLKAAITNAEHEVREEFSFAGRRAFNPHVDVRALAEVSRRVDARPAPPTENERQEVLG